MKILLTGANGQLGRALQAALTAHAVSPLSHTQLDITKLAATRAALQALRPQVVINAAAYTNVDAAENDADNAYRVNTLGARNLALATAEHGCALVQVSTDYVFAGDGQRPLHEFDVTAPQSVYGHSKLAGEQQVAQFNPRHYIVRTAWLYHTSGRNFPLTMLAQAQRSDLTQVRVVNDQTGSPTFAPHLAAAIAELITTQAYGTYHLAGRGGATWYDFTRELYRACRVTLPIEPVTTEQFPRPAKRPVYSVLTTLQDPPLYLPTWETGVAEFAAALAS